MSAYDFSTLSPHDFECLVGDLLTATLGVRLQRFRQGRDKGVDLRFAGVDGNPDLVVQCKHYHRSTFATLLRKVKEEIPKIQLLAPKRYILATSFDLSVGQIDELFEVLKPYCQSKDDIFGRIPLNDVLEGKPNLHQRHFKLWFSSTSILERIVNSDVFVQSSLAKEAIIRRLSTYVPCKATIKAKNILDQQHTCIIAGLPGIGKTTLAHILCAEFLANDWEVIHVYGDLREGVRVLKEDQSLKQVIYYDDFLGQTNIGDKLSKNEDKLLVTTMEHFSRSPNKRLILTTRDYILAQAKRMHEALDRVDLNVKKYVLSLEDYSKVDKAKILASHLHFQGVSSEHIEAIVSTKTYEKIVSHRNYNPRIIAAVTDTNKIAQIPPARYPAHFIQMLDNPTEIWESIFQDKISESSRNLLLVLATCGAEVTIDDLRKAFLAYHGHLAEKYKTARSTQDFERSLKELESNFVKIARYPSAATVAFHNPSIADFIGNYFRDHLEDVGELLLTAVHFEQVIRTVGLVTPPQKDENDPETLRCVQFLASQLTEAFSKTLLAQSTSFNQYGYGAGRFDIKKLPLNIVDRLLWGVRLSKRLKFDGFSRLIEGHCGEYFTTEQLSVAKPWASQITPLLIELEDCGQHKPERLNKWRSAALPSLLAEPETMEEAVASSIWLGRNKGSVSDEQWRAFLEVVEDRVLDFLRSILDDEGDPDVIESAASDAEEISNALGLNFLVEIQELSGRAEDIRKEDEKNSPSSDWSPAFTETKESDEDIASIFDALVV